MAKKRKKKIKREDIKPGIKIRMKIPHSRMGETLCHVMAILDNPEKTTEGEMIVFRYWSKWERAWFWKVFPYGYLAIWNKWESKWVNK